MSMWYVPVTLLILGLVVLGLLGLRLLRGLRRVRRAASMVVDSTHERTSLLRARSAALRVAIGQRCDGLRPYHRP